MLSLSMQMKPVLRQELRQWLSLKQRLVINMKITPRTQCPQCGYRVDPERDHPWSEDPLDIQMTCPNCQRRFTAHLYVEQMDHPSLPPLMPHDYAYLCITQTLHALLDIRAARTPHRFPGMKRLHRERPEVFYSAIKHFGNLEPAIAAARERSAQLRAA